MRAKAQKRCRPGAAQAFHVSKSYPAGGQRRRILREVSFTLPAGARVALMGPNGSGKTTLLRKGVYPGSPRTPQPGKKARMPRLEVA
ncbi:MAG: ATP-binding cassette domain-containing protein [Firmicutes bacterium]|nr:ATP-binding cassette domain-containing protein [Bacillota bacterium]